MTKLHVDWLTEGVLDFEYKKYVLLAYLQQIQQEFSANRLYPHLPELQLHLDACVRLRTNQQAIRRTFPKNVTGVDVDAWKLVYQDTIQEDSYVKELADILDFAIPGLSKTVEEGSRRFWQVGDSIRISPLGIVPLRLEEGYLFICHAVRNIVSIFQYQLALYNDMKERYLNTFFIDTIRLSLGHSLNQVKVDLIKQNRSLPNPATYVVEASREYPLEETLLPVAKRMMLKQLNIS